MSLPVDSPFSTPFTPDWEAFRACIMREGTPERVHHIELFLDREIEEALCQRYGLLEGLNPDDPAFPYRRMIRIQRFVGYDYVRQGVDAFEMPLNRSVTEDTAEYQRTGGRSYVNESKGPITTWDEFERYPWPDPEKVTTRALEWYEQNLPDDMCVIGSGGFAHFAEYLTWLMGYETLCYALYDQRDLVQAIADRLLAFYVPMLERILTFERVKIIWGSDDMGFKTGPMISPDDLRKFVLPGHKRMAAMSHAAGRPYILHSCGNLATIYEDLIEDVGIDGKHSFEDTIEDVRELKSIYGDRIALLGGIDVDFLCRASPEAIRQRVRDTLDICMPGGGYCLGTGNSVANYIPLENYLAMVDEGRRYDP
ncbi:MAG: uroporphyrinogen decarboxylase family protein [Anaerolineae bacterium]